MVSVNLREKEISGNRSSLYLDFYPAIANPKTGKTTRREFLQLYVTTKPRTELDRIRNKETRYKAQIIQGKRQDQLQNEEYGFLDKEKRNSDFVVFFTELAAKRKGTNSDNWQSCLNHLKSFCGGTLKFREVTEDVCNEFKEYLLNATSKRSSKAKLKKNSASGYFNKFIAALKVAFKKGFLTADLAKSVDLIKPEETHREFLTLHELQMVANAPCTNSVLKRAALFSALTGLRFSDIAKLLWREIRKTDFGYEIQFIQKKTKGAETLPISVTAYNLLGTPGKKDDRIFTGLKYSAYTNKQLHAWLKGASIEKKCGFHNFRHTNATLLLQSGVDLYVISKLLGHKDISTTALYTKVMDQKKIEASTKINLELDAVLR